MQKKILDTFGRSDPSIAGISKKYIRCDQENHCIEITGTQEQNITWAQVAYNRLGTEIRKIVFDEAIGEQCEVYTLKAYEKPTELLSEKQNTQTSAGKELSWMPEKLTIPVGEGILNFLDADFEKIAKKISCDKADHHNEQKSRRWYSADEQILYDFLCLSETMRFFHPLITASIYTTLFPPVMCARTANSMSKYYMYLKRVQNELKELIQFVFDKEYFPKAIGSLSASQRYALFCRLKHSEPHYEYTSTFDSVNYELNPDTALSLRAEKLYCEDESENEEVHEFCEQYHLTKQEIDDYQTLPFYFFPRIQITNIPDMLMYEFFQMLELHVELKKCKRCGKYFVVKGKHAANYCSRVADGTTQTCQDLSSQERYKKKMENNAAIPLQRRYYKRYAARVRAHQIKEQDFQKWKYQAIVKRTECIEGKITLQEFEDWLEACYPNRKKVKK